MQFGFRLQSFAVPPGCQAGGEKKYLAHFATQTKEGTGRAGLAGGDGVVGRRTQRGRVTVLVFKLGFNSSNTDKHEASAAGEYGC